MTAETQTTTLNKAYETIVAKYNNHCVNAKLMLLGAPSVFEILNNQEPEHALYLLCRAQQAIIDKGERPSAAYDEAGNDLRKLLGLKDTAHPLDMDEELQMMVALVTVQTLFDRADGRNPEAKRQEMP